MAETRFYGKLRLQGKFWIMEADPNVLMRAKRIFQKIDKSEIGKISLSDTKENARELQWLLQRYPMEMDVYTTGYLKFNANQFHDHVLKMNQIIDGKYQPRQFNMALPPRDYQVVAANIYLGQRFLLLADTLGLGKSCSIITSFCEPRVLPALVVVPPFLKLQWEAQIKKFMPQLKVHTIKKKENYPIPRGTDVVICGYMMLHAWAGPLSQYCKSAAFDEAQELRRSESDKYKAAKFICDRVGYTIGASATPVFNYGGEMFNVMNCLKDGCLGDEEEFIREWCTTEDGINGTRKVIVRDPVAFGSYLKENFMMLRRTREDVGKELPEVVEVVEIIEASAAVLDQIKGKAAELARIILSQSSGHAPEDRMNAAGQLDNLVRQQTGIAKAPFVAEFVKMVVESGERVLLFAWHRSVYEILKERFASMKIGCDMFTGSETAAQKEAAKTKFINGDTQVLMMSLRSGAGIDGLQEVCNVVMFGELDWSSGVHAQCVGRLHRDGQRDNVTAYFLCANDGSDPLMMDVLGMKGSQIAGINDGKEQLILGRRDVDHVKRLAEKYLRMDHK